MATDALTQDLLDPERSLPDILADLEHRLAGGADPSGDFPKASRWGRASLPAQAVVFGCPEVLARLLQAGAPLEDPDHTPASLLQSPLRAAAVDLLAKAVRVWVSHAASGEGLERNTRVIEVLVDHGASPLTPDPMVGKSAWDLWVSEVDEWEHSSPWGPQALEHFPAVCKALLKGLPDPEKAVSEKVRWETLQGVGPGWRALLRERALNTLETARAPEGAPGRVRL